jgi:hypothetical protein
MAAYRKLHTSYWTDPFVEELTQEQKLFYVYLISNTKTRQSGIYEITKKYIQFETGFSIKEVSELIQFFISKGKIAYSEITNEIAITNWFKHNRSTSPKVLKCVHEDLKEVKDISLIKVVYTKEYTEALLKELEGQKDPYTPIIEFLLNIHTLPIEYQYGIDTSPQQEQAQAKAEEQKETKEETKAEAEEQTKAEVISTSKFTYKNLITNSFEEKDLSKDFDNIL